MRRIEELILRDEEGPISRVKLVESKLLFYTESELDIYMLNSTKAYAAILLSLDKAHLSIELLEHKYIVQNKADEHAINEYIELFIENAIIRIQSIYDRVLIFVNRLFEIGISNKNITHDLIVTNDNVKRVGLDTKLRNLNRVCKEYRNIRNTIIHHDRYREEDFDLLCFIHKAEFMGKKAGDDAVFPEGSLDKITSEMLVDFQENLQKHLTKIESKLDDIFDIACDIYQMHKSMHKKYTKTMHPTSG